MFKRISNFLLARLNNIEGYNYTEDISRRNLPGGTVSDIRLMDNKDDMKEVQAKLSQQSFYPALTELGREMRKIVIKEFESMNEEQDPNSSVIDMIQSLYSDQTDDKGYEGFIDATKNGRWGDQVDLEVLLRYMNAPCIVFNFDEKEEGNKATLKAVCVYSPQLPGKPVSLLLTNPVSSTNAHWTVLIPDIGAYDAENKAARLMTNNSHYTMEWSDGYGVNIHMAVYLIPANGDCLFIALGFLHYCSEEKMYKEGKVKSSHN